MDRYWVCLINNACASVVIMIHIYLLVTSSASSIFKDLASSVVHLSDKLVYVYEAVTKTSFMLIITIISSRDIRVYQFEKNLEKFDGNLSSSVMVPSHFLQ